MIVSAHPTYGFRGFGVAREGTESDPVPAPVPTTPAGRALRVVDYSDGNWIHGVSLYGEPAIVLDATASDVSVGDQLAWPGDVRQIMKVWASMVGGIGVTISGGFLPANHGTPSTVTLIRKSVSVPAPIPTPAPDPSPAPGGGIIDQAKELARQAEAYVAAQLAVITAAVPLPSPLFATSGDPLARLRPLMEWTARVRAKADADPVVGSALANLLAVTQKPQDSGGIFSTLMKAGKWVVDAAGNVVDTIGDLLPTPADYNPEKLIVTGLTDPARFAVLLGAASLVVPVLGTAYVSQFTLPAAPVAGLPLAVAEALARGGWDRVVSNIFDPIYNDLQDKAKFLVDYALNGNSAIARWGVLKIAGKLGDSIVKAILLAIAESTNIIDLIRDPSRLKDEGTFLGLGELIQKVANAGAVGAGAFRDGAYLVGETLKTLASTVSVILKKGASGIGEALDAAAQKVLGFAPSEILSLPEAARREVAKLKLQGEQAFKINIVDKATEGVSTLVEALGKLPWGAGDLVKTALSPLRSVIDQLKAFLAQLKGFANQPEPQPAPTPQPSPAPSPAPVPMKPASGAAARLFKIAAGAGGGMLIAGPPGALIGAGAGAIV